MLLRSTLLIGSALLLSLSVASAFVQSPPRAASKAPPRLLTPPLHASTADINTEISECLSLLNRAAETKTEDPELVYDALMNLEKLERQKAKADPTVAQDMLQNLNGSWRLVFTTGTADTQKKIKGKVNYFPLKVRSLVIVVDPSLFSRLTPITTISSTGHSNFWHFSRSKEDYQWHLHWWLECLAVFWWFWLWFAQTQTRIWLWYYPNLGTQNSTPTRTSGPTGSKQWIGKWRKCRISQEGSTSLFQLD